MSNHFLTDIVQAARHDAQKLETNLAPEALNLLGISEIHGKPDIQKAAVDAINNDFSTIAAIADLLPNGTIEPKDLIDAAQDITGKKLSGSTVKFLESFSSISKEGDHFQFHSDKGVSIPLNESIGGIATAKTLDIGQNFSFDLGRDNKGDPQFANLRGASIGIDSSIPGIGSAAGITALTVTKDSHGHSVFNATLDNPASSIIQSIVGEPDSYNLEVQFSDTGKAKILNKSQLKKEALGNNPFFEDADQTATDTGKFFNNPSAGGALNVFADGANTVFIGAPEAIFNALNPF